MARNSARFKGFSLTFKLGFGFTLLLIALMGFIGFSVFMRDRDSFTKNTIERGWNIVHSTNVVALDAITSERYQVLNNMLAELKIDGFVTEAAVFDDEGKIVASSSSANDYEENTYLKTVYKKVDEPKIVPLKNANGNVIAFAFASPITDSGGNIFGFTHMLVDFSSILEHLQKTGYNLIILFLVAVFLGLIMARYIVIKSVGKPVVDLMKATEKVSLGDFSSRIDITRNDELGSLAQAFNKMSDQLQVLFYSIKHVVSEMHLTSSLIAQRADDFEETGPSLQKEFIKEIHHSAKKLNRISQQLDSLTLQFKTRE
ncbi:MAG TPA: cell wall metabolism sensor histidine kinase WalK [Thermoanaerobacterales bacterium]|nr:cell wall metabolism sensor histidine kinase WalK [Thermoanaerobacterales bacterium]